MKKEKNCFKKPKMYNLTQNLYAEINDSQDTKTISGKDLLNGTYNFNITNTERAVTYSLKIYSGSSGCYGKLLTSKRVKKGVVNKFSFDNSCKGIEEYYYCQTILDTPITISDEMVYKNIENYKKTLESNSDNDEEFNISNFANKYWINTYNYNSNYCNNFAIDKKTKQINVNLKIKYGNFKIYVVY